MSTIITISDTDDPDDDVQVVHEHIRRKPVLPAPDIQVVSVTNTRRNPRHPSSSSTKSPSRSKSLHISNTVPSTPTTASNDIEIISTRTVCNPSTDLPHFRFSCAASQAPCPNCFCYVCDMPSARCTQPEAHAKATDSTPFWQSERARTLHTRSVSKRNALQPWGRAAIHPPRPHHHHRPHNPNHNHNNRHSTHSRLPHAPYRPYPIRLRHWSPVPRSAARGDRGDHDVQDMNTPPQRPSSPSSPPQPASLEHMIARRRLTGRQPSWRNNTPADDDRPSRSPSSRADSHADDDRPSGSPSRLGNLDADDGRRSHSPPPYYPRSRASTVDNDRRQATMPWRMRDRSRWRDGWHARDARRVDSSRRYDEHDRFRHVPRMNGNDNPYRRIY